MALFQRAWRACVLDSSIENSPGAGGTRASPTAKRERNARAFGRFQDGFVLANPNRCFAALGP
jgi:hypothetical protein